MASGAVAAAQPGTSRAPKRNFASRVFGYDLFISFALGPPPRGTHSYASDLARRLRECDFTVFFSEDEAAPGEQLDSTLLNALYRSRTLVVVANRGTLQEPRWVRQEVETFRSRHPDRPIIPISVGGALQDATLADQTRQWLAFDNKIWLDESHDAVAQGIASDEMVARLAMVPAGRAHVAQKWRS
jgi:TIR domain